MWTLFWDMHSGGDQKEKWSHIYIEAPRQEAEIVFYNRFGHNPNRVTCTCCGEDYSISEDDDLEAMTLFHRGGFLERKPKCTLEKYKAQPDVLFISAADINPEERVGELPQQGYVWVD